MKKHFLILISITLIFSSCLYDGGETIVLPIDDIDPLKGMVSEGIIPLEIRDRFTRYMTIHEGTNPPIITGYYILNPVEIIYSSDGQYDKGDTFADWYVYFGEQHKWIINEYREKQAGINGTAKDVVIVGNGNDFTVYYILESYSDRNEDGTDETYTKQSVLFSGTFTSYGIDNAQYAFIMLDKKDPLGVIMDKNEFRIFKDGNGLASTCSSWGYYAPNRVLGEFELEKNTLTKDAKKNYE